MANHIDAQDPVVRVLNAMTSALRSRAFLVEADEAVGIIGPPLPDEWDHNSLFDDPPERDDE